MKMKSLTVACGVAWACSLGGCFDSSTSPSTTSFSGVVAAGVPVVGVTVTVTDANGKTASSAPTDANGNYAISAQGLQAPFVLTAAFTEIDGTPGTLSSVSSSGSTVHANLTPITSLITQRVLATTLNGAPSGAQISGKVTSAGIQQATRDVTGTLGPLFSQLGVPASSSNDPIGSNYTADPSVDKMDALLEVSRINVHNGTVSVGYGTGNALVHVPPNGTVDAASTLTPGALTSVSNLETGPTTTPIQHVIVVITENQTFDAIYGAYQPKSGNTIKNLLSEGIINADGSPGPNFSLAAQKLSSGTGTYSVNPGRTSAYTYLPQPLLTGIYGSNLLPLGNAPDTRYPTTLPNGPFQISKYVPYAITAPTVTAITNTFSADPVHRFFQMWQQTGGTNTALDLYTWVATTTGQGGNTTVDTTGGPVTISAGNPGQGGELMGFYNMNSGDAPVFKTLADNYAISDNYHQSIMGGTGMNFFSIATGDLPVYNTGGTLSVPPANQIENPDPTPGTANFYQQDGYQGGSYIDCSDPTQPGVSAILTALSSAGRQGNCASGAYYLVNNYNPPYKLNGSTTTLGATSYVYPPQTVPTIGEELSANNISWKWYLGGRDAADVTGDRTLYPLVRAQVSAAMPAGTPASVIDAYAFAQAQPLMVNPIGDPDLASQNVMTSSLKNNLVGLTTFYNDVQNGTLPAVSFVVPKNLDSGHPGNSSPILAENFINNLVTMVKASPQWNNTAIIITTDEGGGYFDSGKIQMLDFFGDGPRIPLLVISPYAKTGYVDHVYNDHASILKFIERNWRLKPLSPRSRDRLPDPVANTNDLYMPTNGPSIGDLMTMFQF